MAADEGPALGSPVPDAIWNAFEDILEDLSPNHCSPTSVSLPTTKTVPEAVEEEKVVPPIPPAAAEVTYPASAHAPVFAARVADVGGRWKRVKEMSDAIASIAFFAMSRRLSPQETTRLGQLATELYHELLSLRESTLPPVDPLKNFSWSMPAPERAPALPSPSAVTAAAVRPPVQELIMPAYAPYARHLRVVPRAKQHMWVTEEKPVIKRRRKLKTCEHARMPGACTECAAQDEAM